MSGRVPDLLVEKLRLGELPPAQAAAVHARLAAAGELARLDVHDDVGPLPDHVRHATRPAPRRSRSWSFAVLAASVAAALFVFVPSLGIDQTRTKGGPSDFGVYRMTRDGFDVLTSPANVQRGDVVQLRYRVTRPGMAAIYSIDGRGVLTEHRAPAAVTPGEVLRTRAFELDDAPRFERFVLVLGRDLDRVPITRAIANAIEPDDPIDIAGAKVLTFLLMKAP